MTREDAAMRSGSLCVLALDPGGSTGWAAYQAEVLTGLAGAQLEFHNEKIVQGQLGPELHHLALWNLLGEMHVTNFIIVCESFEFRGEDRTNIRLISKEYIGVVELFTQERNRTLPDDIKVRHVPQTAATGKSFWYPKVPGKKATWDGSKLKALGLYHPTTNGRHINDATAHLLRYLVDGPFKQLKWYHKLKAAENS
jgi:hypothetical protein